MSDAIDIVPASGAPGLTLPDGLDIDNWTEIGRRLGAMRERVQWWLGDWWAYGDQAYGARAALVAEGIFGRAYQTFRNLAVVSRTFEPSRRRDGVSFTHHAEVTTLPSEVADEVLLEAERRGWSTRETRSEVLRRKLQTDADERSPLQVVEPESPFGYALHCLTHLIAAALGMEPASFVGETKGSPQSVHARQVLFYLLHTEGEFPQAEIANALGRNRSTVAHAMQVIIAMREEAEIDQALDKLGVYYRELRAIRESVPAAIEAVGA